MTSIELELLDELPTGLIKARVASGLSQKELAAKLSLKEQQIQRYEANDYAGASLARILEVANALRITVRLKLTIGHHRTAEDLEPADVA